MPLTLGIVRPASWARSGAVLAVGRTDMLRLPALVRRWPPAVAARAAALASPSPPPSSGSLGLISGFCTPGTFPTRWLVGKVSTRPLGIWRTERLTAAAAAEEEGLAPAVVVNAAITAATRARTTKGLRRVDTRCRRVLCMHAPVSSGVPPRPTSIGVPTPGTCRRKVAGNRYHGRPVEN